MYQISPLVKHKSILSIELMQHIQSLGLKIVTLNKSYNKTFVPALKFFTCVVLIIQHSL